MNDGSPRPNLLADSIRRVDFGARDGLRQRVFLAVQVSGRMHQVIGRHGEEIAAAARSLADRADVDPVVFDDRIRPWDFARDPLRVGGGTDFAAVYARAELALERGADGAVLIAMGEGGRLPPLLATNHPSRWLVLSPQDEPAGPLRGLAAIFPGR